MQLLTSSSGGVASMVRMKYIPGLAITSFAFFSEATDTAVWSIIEPGLGIIAGSLATLRPLFRSFLLNVRTIAESGMDTRDPNDTVKSGYARSIKVISKVNEEPFSIGDMLERAQNSHNKSGVKIDKEPWKPGGGRLWESTPQPSVIVHNVDRDDIEMAQTRSAGVNSHMNIPVMKRESAEIHDLHVVEGLPRRASSTAGSESPMIGYAR
jgi:hypothetical protein